MTTETSVQNLKINKLTQAQYSTITPSETELYMITDDTTYQLTSNLVTTITTASTDTTYPSAKLLYDSLETKVSKTGDTMTGRLQLNYPSVSDNPPIIIKSTNLDFDTTENTDIFPPLLEFVDENNNRMAQIEYIKYSDGSHYLSFSDKKNSTESLFSAFFLGWDSNGNELCKLPRTEYPKILVASGIIANAEADSTLGAGTATVILHNSGLAEIHYAYEITTSGSNSQGWSWGLNRDLLVMLNSNIPTITPIVGGTLIIFRSDGVVDTGSNGYGGINSAMSQFWQPARIYQTDGAYGGWSSNTFPVGYRCCGVAYGTYVVT